MMDELFVFIKYELNVPSKGLYMMEHLSSSSGHSSSLEPEQLSSCRHSAKALNLKSSIKRSVLGPLCKFRNTYQTLIPLTTFSSSSIEKLLTCQASTCIVPSICNFFP